MDGLQFDFLAKAAHQTPSRRRFIAGVAGAAAAVIAGRASMDDALAQEVGAAKFDLTCKQSGVGFYCADGGTATNCGPERFGCKCGRERQNNGRVCIEQPEGDCPGKRDKCRKNSDCGANEVCIKVPNCCPRNPGRGVCTRRCDE